MAAGEPPVVVPHRPARTSLRFRLAAALILLGAAVLVAQAVIIERVVERQEEEFINDILHAEMDRLLAHSRAGAGEIVPQGRMELHVARSPAERQRLPAAFRELGDGVHEVALGGAEHHVAVRRQGDAAYYLSYDVARHEERLHDFQNSLLAVLAAALLALVAVSIWLSGVLSRQVRDLAGRVRRLDPGIRQPAALAAHYRDREVVTLAAALDEYARRVAALVGREKEFTGNVSHELRTPLTTIRTGCELLAQDPALSARSRSRVHSLIDGADHIAELMDALLLLAREAPLEAEEAVDLAELAAETAAPLRAALEAKGLRLAIDIAPGAVARTNRTALRLALANLLKNALAYTDRGEVRVRYADGVIAVSDTGVGIAEADVPRVFDRAFRGANARAGGTGIGLAIVKRLADRFGWRIDAESAPEKGTTFRILLGPSRKLHA
jgi:signal transduction histidine kinase